MNSSFDFPGAAAPADTRLVRAFARQGIRLERHGDVFEVANEHAEARILLPASLPLEDRAVRQLLDFASVRSPDDERGVCKACATPDFHPGSVAPVGSIVATDADFVIPAAIGTDINCGMRLVRTGLTLGALAPHRRRLLERLSHVLLESGRDVPVSTAAFKALFDAGPAAFLESLAPQGVWARIDRAQLLAELARCVGLAGFESHSRHVPSAYLNARHEVFRDPCLGTPGAGNHFVELQVVDAVLERHVAHRAGLVRDEVVLMIHSGSRDLGFHVGHGWMDRARAAWPAGLKHPKHGLYGLSGPLAHEYLQAMGAAARYAWANRVVLAELVRQALEDVTGSGTCELVVDVPHNVVMREHGLNVHRKGATPAHAGELALIPGSMGDVSYLVNGLGSDDWLWSCSHGAGRAVRRQAVRAMRAPRTDADVNASWECVTLREERRIEEAPWAYKPIGPVIESQERAGLITPVARLRPWVTFKA